MPIRRTRTKSRELRDLRRQHQVLQESVAKLEARLKSSIPDDRRDRGPKVDQARDALALKRYVRATDDGWLQVMMSGTKTSLPSGLAVTITSQTGGRDYGTIDEGIYLGKTFDVTSGNVVSTAERNSSVSMLFEPAQAPVVIDGITYDRQLTVSWTEREVAKSMGPFPAKTHATNPTPSGTHDVEIADYPHPDGKKYGVFGTVWFRIGNMGDRYVHPGRLSDGCLTCAPGNWQRIYAVLNSGRLGDGQSVGRLQVT
jgi:hypothetical protein